MVIIVFYLDMGQICKILILFFILIIMTFLVIYIWLSILFYIFLFSYFLLIHINWNNLIFYIGHYFIWLKFLPIDKYIMEIFQSINLLKILHISLKEYIKIRI